MLIGYLLAVKKRAIASVTLGVAAALYGYTRSNGDWAVGVLAAASFVATAVVVYFILDYLIDRHHRT